MVFDKKKNNWFVECGGFSLFFGLFLGNFLDNSDGNGLFHISDCESSEGGILGEGFNAHGLGWDHDYDSGLILFNEFGFSFDRFTSSLVNFVQ